MDHAPDPEAPRVADEAPGLAIKPSPARLYGRQRTHALRPRQRVLLDRVLPRFRLDPARPLATHAFTGAVTRVWLDIGFGGGEHTRALAAHHPDTGIIGAEVFEQGLCSMLAAYVSEGAEDHALPPRNLRLWDQDARALLAILPPQSLDRVHLMFPDPWPKARHAKRRFVHPETLTLVARALIPGGEWRMATDDPTYQAWIVSVFETRSDFSAISCVFERPYGWPATRYEEKALKAGRKPYYFSWRKV